MKFRKKKLGDIYNFQYGSGNTIDDNGGDYPIYGSNGPVGFTDKYNSEDSPVIGHIGAYAGIVNWAPGKHFVTYNGVICQVKNGIDKRFAYYALRNADLTKRVRGSTQPFVSYDLLQDIDILLPDENEQRKISRMLNSIDSKILANNNIIETSEKLMREIYDYWFVQFDFPDENGCPITVEGNGEINIEIAAATELSAEAPDDLLNVLARNFNKSRAEINGKRISVSIRKITSGETLTYMTDGDYEPDVYIPSSYAWGEMLEAKGLGVITLTDRMVGNTAGILMEKKTYGEFTEKYGDVTVDKVLEASLNGDLKFAYTNPYTSATGLNILATMLHSFDPENPLSEQASQKLLEYQQKSPPVAYTTAVLRTQASRGVITAMVMEEQAFHNTPELKDYIYVPAGIRHDHPVYTFDYVSDEKQEAAKVFVEYCLSDEAQKIANSKGFNLHNDYIDQSAGLDGAGYLSAQKIWKLNKDGGRPVIAVFVADVSGSMDGSPIKALRDSLISTAGYISSEHYVGLVSYSNDVTINLPIEKFDETQRAYFSGAVKSLTASGGTATYDAVLVALDMLNKKAEEVPDAKLMLFVLSDGAQNQGYNLNKITDIVRGMKVPVYTIGYNLSDANELDRLSKINEAASVNAETDDIPNHLRNLFNVEL